MTRSRRARGHSEFLLGYVLACAFQIFGGYIMSAMGGGGTVVMDFPRPRQNVKARNRPRSTRVASHGSKSWKRARLSHTEHRHRHIIPKSWDRRRGRVATAPGRPRQPAPATCRAPRRGIPKPRTTPSQASMQVPPQWSFKSVKSSSHLTLAVRTRSRFVSFSGELSLEEISPREVRNFILRTVPPYFFANPCAWPALLR